MCSSEVQNTMRIALLKSFVHRKAAENAEFTQSLFITKTFGNQWLSKQICVISVPKCVILCASLRTLRLCGEKKELIFEMSFIFNNYQFNQKYVLTAKPQRTQSLRKDYLSPRLLGISGYQNKSV